MYYDWHKILKEKNDSELFQALYEVHLPIERRIAAEQLLFEKKIISKNVDGSYFKEIIDKKFLILTERSVKSNSIEKTVDILVRNGLDKESSQRLIEYYIVWKKKYKRRQIIWSSLFFISLTIQIFSEIIPYLRFMNSISSILILVTAIPIIKPLLTNSGFQKNKIFRVLIPLEA